MLIVGVAKVYIVFSFSFCVYQMLEKKYIFSFEGLLFLSCEVIFDQYKSFNRIKNKNGIRVCRRIETSDMNGLIGLI